VTSPLYTAEKTAFWDDVMPIISFGKKIPKIDPTAFIFQSATIIGDVEIGARSSIWPNAVIRGDLQPIKIGENTSVQDNVVIHAPRHSQLEAPVTIGDNVSLGHSVVLHGCEIADNSLIGIHAVVLDRAKIGRWVLVGAGAVVPPNTVIPSKSLVLGVPGKVVRELKEEDMRYIEGNAQSYARTVEEYKKRGIQG
jgi:carbonic anhydrase/acetyltransferase-like protein (isoleucine patch superfamily)